MVESPRLLLVIACSILFFETYAQSSISTIKHLNFGSFCLKNNSSGTVTVNSEGARTATGGIVLLNFSSPYSNAEIEVNNCESSNVIITYSSSSILTYGDHNILLTLGPSSRGGSGSSFYTTEGCSFSDIISIGGTLNLSTNAVPGNYSGSFQIIINNE